MRQKGHPHAWAISVLSIILVLTSCTPVNPSKDVSNTPSTNAAGNTTHSTSGNNSNKVPGGTPDKILDSPPVNVSKNITNDNSPNPTGNVSPGVSINISNNVSSNNITKPSGPVPLPLIAASSLRLIFADNFSSNKSGWANGTNGNQTYVYQAGEYRVSNKIPDINFRVWNNLIPQQTNFVAEVGTRLLSSNNNSEFGLIFQLDDQADYYAFTVSGDRYSVWVNGGSDALLQPYTFSNYIKTDGSINQLRVARLGKTIEVYVNGQRLATLSDSSLNTGRVGFWVSDVTSVAFTDFKVYNFTDDYVRVADPDLLPRTVAAQNIGTAGGTITVDIPGNSPGAFQITVPKDAYTGEQPFQVTIQDVPSPTPNFVAGSPLITLETGGVTPQKPITIKIPVTYGADEYPIVCEIDEAGSLQPVTTTALDKNAIGVTFYIFPQKIQLMVLIARNQTLANLEAQQIQTFKPGKDDWHFVNPNTYLSNGNCAGMSMTAIYYFNEIYSKGKGGNLYGRYLGNETDLDEDDRQALRLVSLVQLAYAKSDAYLDRINASLYSKDNPLIISSNVNGDEITYKSFVAAIAITRQPQLIFVWGKDKSTNETAGHAMIVYGVKNALLLADPNNPGVNGLTIPFVNGKLGPYNTDPGDRNSGQIYDTFQFIGRGGAFLSWNTLGDFWSKINDSSLGDTVFPKYSIKLADDQGKVYSNDVKDGSNITVNRPRIILNVSSSENLSLAIYRDGFFELGEFPPKSHSANVDLDKRVNVIGIYVRGYDGTSNSTYWTDFRWVTINISYPVYQITMNLTINADGLAERSYEKIVTKESMNVIIQFDEFKLSPTFPDGRLYTSTNGSKYQYNGIGEYYRHPSGPRFDPSWVLQTDTGGTFVNSGVLGGYATIPWRSVTGNQTGIVVGATQSSTLSLFFSGWRPQYTHLWGPHIILINVFRNIFSKDTVLNPAGETVDISGSFSQDFDTVGKRNYTYKGTMTLTLVRFE